MKTERMVLLVTPAEKARIMAEAGKLGVSASEYVRRVVAIIDAEDIAELEGIAALMPALAAAMESIETNIDRTVATIEEAERDWAYQRSDEYRDKVRAEILADPTIDWDGLDRLFGRDRETVERAA